MASLSLLPRLIEGLREVDPVKNPHAWLTDGALMVGSYPAANMTYDFAVEKMNALTSEPTDIKEKKRTSLVHRARRDTGDRYDIETSDQFYECASATQALIEGLKIVESLVPGTLDQLSKEKGRSKRPVAQSLEDLYDIPSQRRYHERLPTGHYVATNNKTPEALGFIRRAAALAKLTQDQFSVKLRRR